MKIERKRFERIKNIYRTENRFFEGWRVTVIRGGVSLVRYFSDRDYGDSAEISLKEAKFYLAEVLEALANHPKNSQAVILLDFIEKMPHIRQRGRAPRPEFHYQEKSQEFMKRMEGALAYLNVTPPTVHDDVPF